MTTDCKSRLAWVPIPLLLAAIAALWAADLRTAHESQTVLTVCNFLFSTAASVLVAILIGRSYLLRGSPGLLLLGCGVLIWGAAGTLVPVLFPYGTNALIGGHNSLVWLSALCHLSGVLLSLRSWRAPRLAGLALAVAYAGALCLVWLVAMLATEGRLPVFFVQGRGGTPLRTFVLGSAIALFAFTAAVLWRANRPSPSAFVRWYGAALLLVATGLIGIMFESVHGGALSWTGRAAQFLGGAYMLVAAIVSAREALGGRLSLVAALHETEERYRNLVGLSPEAIIVHQDGRFVFANPAALRLYGASSVAELLGRPVLDLIHPDDREVVRSRMDSSLSGVRTPLTAVRALRLDGQTIHVESTGAPVGFGGRPAVQVVIRDVTERKRAEAALERARSTLAEAQKIAHLGSFEYVAATRATVWSEEECRIYGMDPAGPSPAYDVMLAKCIHPDDAALLHQTFSVAMQNNAVYELEHRIVRPDGGVRWVYDRALPHLDESGKLLRYVGATLDITERKQAEMALRESEARLHALAEALPQIVWTADAAGGVEWYNQRWYEYTGQPPGLGVGWSWDQVAHPDDMPHTIEKWRRAIEQGTLFENEIRVRRHDGRFRWFLVRAWPLRDADGKVVRWFGTNTDVEDMKQAGEDLRRTATDLEAANAELRASRRAAINLVDDAVAARKQAEGVMAALRESREDLNRAQAVAHIGSWRLDLRKNELVWSEENWRIFGVPKGTPLTYETFLSTVHPDDRAHVHQKWSAALRGEPYDVEHRIVVGDTVKWVQEKAEMDFDDKGTLLDGFGTTQDITERKKVEEAIRRTTAELERSNRDLEQFAYVTSHDLKEPLRMVTSFMGLLKTRYAARLDDKAREYIGFAAEGGARMQTLVDDLLAYSRVGRQKVAERVEADAALDRALANLRTAIEESDARIVREPLPRVEANALELTQVFQNLIGNAVKFRRPNVPPEIHVGARRVIGHSSLMTDDAPKAQMTPPQASSRFARGEDAPLSTRGGVAHNDSSWLFSVRDNGIGIDPRYHGRLFQIFQRLHTREEYPGTGVGLAICKKIVERHGGTIWVESEEGKGATFLFALRAAKEGV